MTRRSVHIALTLLAAATGLTAADQPAAPANEAKFVNAAEIAWSPAPPDLPKGGQVAVLHGDPMKSGPFTIRFKMPDGYRIPAHWHSQDEQLTILSGTLLLHMGDGFDSPAHELTVGAYHFLPGRMHHAAEGRGETIVQVEGMGPFDIHYLDPADNPNPTAANK
jgi:hypothetical protein